MTVLRMRVVSSGSLLTTENLEGALIQALDGVLRFEDYGLLQNKIDEIRQPPKTPAAPSLSAEESRLIRERRKPEHYDSLREIMKEHIPEYWERVGQYLGRMQQRELIEYLKSKPGLKQAAYSTIERRIRELADPKIEIPTMLKPWLEGKATGSYILNPSYIQQAKQEAQAIITVTAEGEIKQ